MEPVAEVEVPVQHQHFVLLQVPQRLLTYVLLTAHTCTGTAGLAKQVRPPTMVAATPPRNSHPSNGVFFDRDRRLAASTRTLRSGARMVMSAGAPAASVPPGTRRMRAGLTDSSSMSLDSRMTPL